MSNLREATQRENTYNRKRRKDSYAGLKGVTKHIDGGYVAEVGKIYLGYFRTPEEAHAAYCEAAHNLYGEFFCAG